MLTVYSCIILFIKKGVGIDQIYYNAKFMHFKPELKGAPDLNTIN